MKPFLSNCELAFYDDCIVNREVNLLITFQGLRTIFYLMNK